jgi:uncharacterized membrane protein YgdD (TMEM256/DUF423 family)
MNKVSWPATLIISLITLAISLWLYARSSSLFFLGLLVFSAYLTFTAFKKVLEQRKGQTPR